jgi:hypothetical protein
MTQTTWKKEYEFELPNGKVLEPGWTFKITGEKGKTYRFISVTTNPDVPSTWIDCFGGGGGKEKSRAIFPETINPASAKKPRTRKAE